MRNEKENIKKLIRDFSRFLPLIETEQSEDFDTQFHDLLKEIDECSVKLPDDRQNLMKHLFTICADELDKSVIQSQSRNKPFGYAGDYLLIDWIHTNMISSGSGRIWDEFFQRQKATQAVRNRKGYLCKKIHEVCANGKNEIYMFNIASGPCRDIGEVISGLDISKRLIIHNIDMDKNAVAYAQRIIKGSIFVSLEWEIGNILKKETSTKYDLIWSAGLFDYLNDGLAKALIKKMWCWLKEDGKIIIGNFHPKNPDRIAMEWASAWFLFHRTEEDLFSVCQKAGIPSDHVSFDKETLGINIFVIFQNKSAHFYAFIVRSSSNTEKFK